MKTLKDFGKDKMVHLGLMMDSCPYDKKESIIKDFSYEFIKEKYTKSFQKREEVLKNLKGFEASIEFEIKSSTPFVTGLAQPHLHETGFILNRIFGLPYLQASSLKGLARTSARALGLEKECSSLVQEIFGSEDVHSSDESYSGKVVFHDAWMIPSLQPFEEDIMTPHYGEYYKGKKDDAFDWDSPNPIKFLTVKKDISFSLWIFGPQELLEVAQKLLEWGFSQEGFGAKTNVGYGRFQVIKKS